MKVNVLEWKGQRIKNAHTIIEIGLAITDEAEREKFLALVRGMGPNVLSNIGFCASYYSTEMAKKILTAFKTHHPVFGKDWPDKPISPEKAFDLGRQLASRIW